MDSGATQDLLRGAHLHSAQVTARGLDLSVLTAKASFLAAGLRVTNPGLGSIFWAAKGTHRPLWEVFGDPGCHSLRPSHGAARAFCRENSLLIATPGEERSLKPTLEGALGSQLSGHCTLSTEAQRGWGHLALFCWWTNDSCSELPATLQHPSLQILPSSGQCGAACSISTGSLRTA